MHNSEDDVTRRIYDVVRSCFQPGQEIDFSPRISGKGSRDGDHVSKRYIRATVIRPSRGYRPDLLAEKLGAEIEHSESGLLFRGPGVELTISFQPE